jgi:hypothetical protein
MFQGIPINVCNLVWYKHCNCTKITKCCWGTSHPSIPLVSLTFTEQLTGKYSIAMNVWPLVTWWGCCWSRCPTRNLDGASRDTGIVTDFLTNTHTRRTSKYLHLCVCFFLESFSEAAARLTECTRSGNNLNPVTTLLSDANLTWNSQHLYLCLLFLVYLTTLSVHGVEQQDDQSQMNANEVVG